MGLDSRTKRTASSAARIAMGVLTARHQRHEKYSVSTPPSNSPIAAPPPEMAPKTPKALLAPWDRGTSP